MNLRQRSHEFFFKERQAARRVVFEKRTWERRPPSELLLSIFLFTFFSSFSSSSFASTISVMSYNVENLFDTENDPDKIDETFLPRKVKAEQRLCKDVKPAWRKLECETLDWNDKVVDQKMRQLSKVILSYKSGENLGADVVVIPELENIYILNLLNDRYLGKAGYTTVELLEGPDVRGIDVGVLSRFPLSSDSKLHAVKWRKAYPVPTRPTRSILEVNLSVGKGLTMAVFGVHFPSPSHSTEERMDAFDALNAAVEKSRADLIVSAGDFNVTAAEGSRLYRAYSYDKWMFSHVVGCEHCIGTNYYKPFGKKDARDSWSFLDAIALSKKSASRFSMVNIDVWNKLEGITEGKIKKPFRFNPSQGSGFSDHFPVVAKFKLK